MTVTVSTSSMTTKRRTSPQDWIQDYFSPVLSVYANEDAERIAAKNNLSFTEMLQPFSKMTTDVTIKDADGSNHNVPSLNIILQDFKKDPVKLVNQKLILDRIEDENVDQLVTKHFDKETLDAPGYTPWFDTWMKFYLATLPTVENEYLKHHFGCIFAVSTNTSDPVEQFRLLSQAQHRHQHERSGGGQGSYPQYFTPNILKYYVLVHDSYSSVEDAVAQELFTQVQNAFDSANCHFLQVNSRPPSSPKESETVVAEHWFGFTHRWLSVETRRGKSFTSGMTTSPVTRQEEDDQPPPDHPLASHPLTSLTDSPEPHQPAPPRLTQATPQNVGVLLTANDIDRIRIMVRELVIKSLIPYVEKQLRLLQEVVTNRKSRSLFSGAKRWFGTNKPGSGGGGAAGGTSVVYGREAPELQVRKLADLYFLMRLYKPAYNYAYISKKDFQADEAWSYYAAAVELAALAMFMLASNDPGKKYRPDYMEDAITKYLTLCQAPEFAVRATLFDGLCLKHQGMFTEAATSYIRMTNELSDLRSAMLLEQAAYCFLLATPASVRKYGFHIVLAGYRFSKTGGCKKHAARLYSQGTQVYSGKDWQLSSEHILYTLGHMKFMLKDFSAAAEFFNSLMEAAVSTSSPGGGGHLQQMVHLREFFLVHHARAKEDKGSVVVVTLPRLLSQLTRVSLTDQEVAQEQVNLWQSVEKVVKEVVTGQDLVSLSSTCQSVFDNTSTNHLQPEGVVGEQISVTLTFENVFNTPLQLRKSHLIWRFSPKGSELVVTNDRVGAVGNLHLTTGEVDCVTLAPQERTSVQYLLTVHNPGQLVVTGVEFSLSALFPNKEPTDHEIRGKQMLTIVPRSFNTVKDRKNRTVAGVDRRLEIKVNEEQPRLAVKLTSPESLVQGELRCLELLLTNCGPVPMTNLHLVSQTPGLLSFGKKKLGEGGLYDFPLVQDSGPSFRSTREDGVVEQVSLDVLPVPLPDTRVLEADKSVRLALWVRGPDKQLGPGQHFLYIYYDTAIPGQSSRASPRFTPFTLSLTVQPSLEVECSRLGLLGHSNTPGANIVVKMRNISKELVTSMDTLTVTQVVLVSRNSKIHQVESSSRGWQLARGETNHLALSSVVEEEVKPLDMVRLHQLPATVDIPGGNLHFSSLVLGKGGPGHAVHSPPFTDFMKNHFTYNLGKRGNAPVLHEDLLVLMWRSGGSSPCLGQTFVPLAQEEMVQEEEVEVVQTPAPSYPVVVQARVEQPDRLHHFPSLLGVDVVLDLELQEGQSKGVLVQYRVVKGETKGVRVTGNIEGVLWLEGEDNKTSLKMGATVARAGYFRMDCWQFRAKAMDNCDMTYFESAEAEQFLPVDISFVVRHSSDL